MQRYTNPTLNDVWVYTGNWPMVSINDARDYLTYDPRQLQLDEDGDLVMMHFERGNSLPSAFAHGRDWSEEEEGETFDYFERDSHSPDLHPNEKILFKNLRILYMAMTHSSDLPELNELLIELDI